LQNPEERTKISQRGREIVKEKHTGFDRAAEIVKYLGMNNLADNILIKKMEFINE